MNATPQNHPSSFLVMNGWLCEIRDSAERFVSSHSHSRFESDWSVTSMKCGFVNFVRGFIYLSVGQLAGFSVFLCIQLTNGAWIIPLFFCVFTQQSSFGDDSSWDQFMERKLSVIEKYWFKVHIFSCRNVAFWYRNIEFVTVRISLVPFVSHSILRKF